MILSFSAAVTLKRNLNRAHPHKETNICMYVYSNISVCVCQFHDHFILLIYLNKTCKDALLIKRRTGFRWYHHVAAQYVNPKPTHYVVIQNIEPSPVFAEH